MRNLFGVIVIVVLITGCGGGSSDGGTSDNPPPVTENTGGDTTADVEAVRADLDELSKILENGTIEIYQDIQFPNIGSNGSTLTWSSDRPDLLASDGRVSRPTWDGKDETLMLTLDVSKNEVRESKSFTVIVKQVFPLLKTGGYINYDDELDEEGAERNFLREEIGTDTLGGSIGIVSDMTTGLVWEDIPLKDDDRFDKFQQAIDYCENTTTNGQTDWRVPTYEEMSMLIELRGYNGDNPNAIDHNFIYTDHSTYYYTSTLNTADGLVGTVATVSSKYGMQTWIDQNSITPMRVRCVRGKTLPQNEFFRNDTEETVLDITTGLMWQDTTPIKADYFYDPETGGMHRYCSQLKLGGYSNWRVPNRNELESIVDRSVSRPALNNTFRNIGQFNSSEYWTVSVIPTNGLMTANLREHAFGVDFANGVTVHAYIQTPRYIRCVRHADTLGK